MTIASGGVALTIRTSKDGDKVVLELLGSLTAGEPVMLLNQRVHEQLQDGARHFVIDITHLTRIDSAALGELVSVYTALRKKGVTVKLTGLDAKSRDLLQMTKLLTVFDGSSVETPGAASHTAPRKTVALWVAIVVVAAVLYWMVRRG